MNKENTKSGNRFINGLKKSNMTAIGGVLIVMIIIASVSSPYFLDMYNLQSLIRDLAFVGMIGIAQSLLLLIGELDLSVGKIASLCGILSGMMMVYYGVNPWVALAISLLCGLLFGAINGLIITKLRLNSMVATIGMQGVYGGINLVLTKGKAITGIPEEDVRKAIANGINKVNVGTIIYYTNVLTIYNKLQETGPHIHTLDLMQESVKAIKEVVKGWIKVCMSEGKA